MKPKRILSLLISLVMLLSLLPGNIVLAASGDGTACAAEECGGTYKNGFCSENSTHCQAAELKDGYYEISNAGQLYWFAAKVNAGDVAINARLTDNIVINENVLKTDGNLNSGDFRTWTPIGNLDNVYAGTFDGNGKTISGIYFEQQNEECWIALIGYAGAGTVVKDLGILDSYIYAFQDVGAVIGKLYLEATADSDGGSATVSNCYNKGTIKCGNYGGGLIGSVVAETAKATKKAEIKVENSYNAGKVFGDCISGAGYTGGLFGELIAEASVCDENEGASITVKNCYNTGDVSVLSEKQVDAVGGIAGNVKVDTKTPKNAGEDQRINAAVTLTGCYNSGKVDAQNVKNNEFMQKIGGLVGDFYIYTEDNRCHSTGTIENCYNAGDIIAISQEGSTYDIGGIVGKINISGSGRYNWLYIRHSYNNGNIDAGSDFLIARVGGITGCMPVNRIKIENCYSSGKMTVNTWTQYIGGVVGEHNYGQIMNCYYAKGSVVNHKGEVQNGIGANTGSEADKEGETAGIDAEAFKTGEAAYIMNGSTSEGELLWYQTCGVGTPGFDGGTVYKGYVAGSCSEKIIFANEADKVSDTRTGTHAENKYENNGDGTHKVSCSACGDILNEAEACAYGEDGICTHCQSCSHKSYDDGYCSGCGAIQAAELKDGYYEIGNRGQLYWFAEKVNAGETEINGKLTANITVNPGSFAKDGTYTKKDGEECVSWTPVGTSEKPYTGTFDGGNYEIIGLYMNRTDISDIGLFGDIGTGGVVKDIKLSGLWFKVENASAQIKMGSIAGVSGGTLKNCSATGYIINDASGNAFGFTFTGGIVGYNNGIVELCESRCSIEGEAATAFVGGVAGMNYEGATLKASMSAGDIYGYTHSKISFASYVGGVVGQNSGTVEDCGNASSTKAKGQGSGGGDAYASGVAALNYGTVTRCYSYGTLEAISGGYCQTYTAGVIGVNSGTVSNTYFLNGTAGYGISGPWTNNGTAKKTADEFKNGSMAYLLNGGKPDGVWRQNLGENGDAYPNLTSSKVYGVFTDCGRKNLTGYSNEPSYVDHVFDENGFCINAPEGDAHYVQPKSEDGVYQISKPGELYWFAALVNGTLFDTDRNQSANAVLTQDIDMTGMENYTPIGGTPGLYYSAEGTDKGFSGTFDGRGNVIKNLSIKGSDTAMLTYGVFGTINGTVKNLGVENFTFTLGTQDCRAGGIVGQILTGGAVSNCYVTDSAITATGKVAGGIAGCNYLGTITGCFTKGVTVDASRTGGITGDNRSDENNTKRIGKIIDCYTDAAAVEASERAGTVSRSEAGVTDFTSGRITYLLNNKVYDESCVWRQNLGDGGDALPRFAGKIVYPEFTYCTEGGQAAAYNNTASVIPEHDYDEEDGICRKNPDEKHYKPVEANSDGVYEISTLGELVSFANLVNSSGAKRDAKLMKDIDASSEPALRIGNTEGIPYMGSFDGNGRKITIKITDSTEQYAALFRYVKDATIKNLTVDGTISSNQKFISGIIGRVVNSTVKLENCLCFVDIKSAVNGDGTHGGLIGVVADWAKITISNCGFAGSIIGSDTTSCGGLVGWTGRKAKLTINNSYVAADFELSGNSGNTFARKDTNATVTLTGCYYRNALSDEIYSGASQKSGEEFANGAVAYLLQGGNVWGQKIGADKVPVIGGAKVFEYTYNGEKVYCNDTDSFKILRLGTDEKSATVVIKNAGDYTIVFADYDSGRLANVESFEVSVGEAQAVRVTSTKNLILGTDDKIMLLDGFDNLTPLCEAYEVK